MKTKLFMALCAFGCCQLLQADPTYLSVELYNGSNYSFQIDEMSEISFDDDKLIVNEEDSTSFEIEQVKDFVFSDNDVNKSLLMNESGHLKVTSLSDDHVRIEGLNCNADVSLMSLSGGHISTFNANDDGIVELILPEKRNIYVITDGHHSVKVKRR